MITISLDWHRADTRTGWPWWQANCFWGSSQIEMKKKHERGQQLHIKAGDCLQQDTAPARRYHIWD